MEFRDIQREARAQGWRVERVKKGWVFYPPNPTESPVYWHGTPSDWRAIHNFIGDLRRRGFHWRSGGRT